MPLVFDLETFSEVELGDAGAEAYARHPSTDCLCAAWVVTDEDGNPQAEPESWRPGMPPPAWASSPEIAWAWNVGFDRAIYSHVLAPRYGWPERAPESFACLMARAYYANLPGKLEKAGAILAAEVQKDAAGHRLMMRLAKPARATVRTADPRRLHTPEALDALAAYCRQDAVAEAALLRYLPHLPPMEKEAFALDRTINARGVQVDLALVHACIATADAVGESLREELRSITGGAVESETKLSALAAWLRSRGVEVRSGKGSMDKAAVADLIAQVSRRTDEDGKQALRALRLRQALGKSSLAKFAALVEAAPDGRLRGSLQYGGAHQTLRWAGRLVQTQNLPKGILGSDPEKGPTYAAARAAVLENPGDAAYLCALYGDGTDTPKGNAQESPGVQAVLASLLRCCFIAKPGHMLAIADFNAVEARGVLWLADDANGLGMFARRECLYCAAASAVLGYKVDKNKNKKERNNIGKPTVLGCGYGMGASKFAATFGMSEEIGAKAVRAYRTTFPAVPALWKEIERAAVSAIRDPGQVYEAARRRVAFHFNGRHLRCRLPSGRTLWYRDARLVAGRFEGTVCVEFAYENLTTHQWERGTTWGGSFVENIVQALCRDLLLYALHELEREGMPVVLHVHDEALAEVPDPGNDADRAAVVHRMEAIMSRLPAWAAGFPAGVEGFWSPYWRK